MNKLSMEASSCIYISTPMTWVELGKKGVCVKMGRQRHSMRASYLCRASSESGETSNKYHFNFNEYMVTLQKPLGIRFVQTLDGNIYVEALATHGNAANSKMIMAGDVLRKTSSIAGDGMCNVEDFSHTMDAIKHHNGPISLILERPTVPVHLKYSASSNKEPFNCGRVAVATWNGNILSLDPDPSNASTGGERCTGFVVYSSKFLRSIGLISLAKNCYIDCVAVNASDGYRVAKDDVPHEVISSFSDDDSKGEIEWGHGNFPVDEYKKALERAKNDLTYNHSFGMQYNKITEQLFVGSCIQTESDVHNLARNVGVSAILNLQCQSEQVNWGIDREAIEKKINEEGVVLVNCPIRQVDSADVRRKLPFAVGVLYRLLRKGHYVFVTCTTGIDRSPACVIAYLHWIQDVALQEAFDLVSEAHPCRPDRPALVWATWDLIAMVERGNHNGPPTHSIQFIWNHGCREGEEVLLVGDFRDWKEPIKAVHAGGPKYIVDLRLPQGKYYYKFIVGGQWRHSNSLPTEGDKWGNVNNVIKIGGVATKRFDTPGRPNIKDLTSIKVIERPLTEEERFTLAFAARRMAFSICPIKLVPK